MFNVFRATTASSPLRYPLFLRLWLGLSISNLGDPFTTIALLWFVLQLTGSSTDVSLIILCFSLPGVVTGTLIGALLDRIQPRIVIGIDNLGRALLIGTIPCLYLLGWLQLWHIYILALLAGVLSPATKAGIRVVLPYLVTEQELERANALFSASAQLSYLIGPTFAGIIVARIGGPWALLVDALSFLLMGLLVLSLPAIVHTSKEQRVVVKTKRDWLGFGPLFHIKKVRALALLSLIFFFSYGPIEVALPVYSDKILHTGALGYGLLWSGFGVGALVGALFVSFSVTHFQPGKMQPLIAVLWGLFLCPLAIGHSLIGAIIFFALAAFCWAPYMPIEMSLLQRLVPTHLRGQVFGARLALITAASPLGAVVGGLLLSHFSPSIVIGISGVACIVSGIGGLLSPTLRSLQRVEKEKIKIMDGEQPGEEDQHHSSWKYENSINRAIFKQNNSIHEIPTSTDRGTYSNERFAKTGSQPRTRISRVRLIPLSISGYDTVREGVNQLRE